MEAIEILILGPNQEQGELLEKDLKSMGHPVRASLKRPEEAPSTCNFLKPELILIDCRDIHPAPGAEFLKELHILAGAPMIALLSPHASILLPLPDELPPDTRVIRSTDKKELQAAIEVAVHRKQLINEIGHMEEHLSTLADSLPEESDFNQELISPELTKCRLARRLFESGSWGTHNSLDTLPFAVMMIRPRTREIVYTNRAAAAMGACKGHTCHKSWGQYQEPCSFCLAPDLWSDGKPQYVEAEARGHTWGCYWEPLKPDLYLHYIMDITARKQAEEKIKESLREKELLLREIHHRVKNNLQSISSLLSLQARSIPDQKTKQILKESQNRIKSIALIHDRIYQSESLTSLDFSLYLKSIVSYLTRSFEKNEITVLVQAGEKILLDIDTAFPLALIVNELLSNALKHAFCEKVEGTIEISFHRGKKEIVLCIYDDGAGIPEDVDFETPGTLGLQLVQELAKQIDGSISLERVRGSRFRFSFPVPEKMRENTGNGVMCG